MLRLQVKRLWAVVVMWCLSVTLVTGAQSGIKAGPIGDIAWSPDGSKIAIAFGPENCSNATEHWIDIVKVDNGAILQTLRGHTCAIISVSWNPNGNELASGSKDSTIRIWDLETGQTRLTIDENVTFGRFSITWSPDGTQLANLFDGGEKIEVWDALNGQRISDLEGHTDPINTVAWSPDGNYLASAASDNTVRVWDMPSGQNVLILEGHTSSVVIVDWSPDGTKIASGSGDSTLRIWDAITGQSLNMLEDYQSPVFGVKWSPDGSRIATGDLDGIIIIWDAVSGEQLEKVQGQAGPILDLEWNPDGSEIAYVGMYPPNGMPEFLDAPSVLSTEQSENVANVPDYPVTHIVLSGDGTRLGVLGRTTQNAAGEIVYYADILDAQTLEILSTVEIGVAQPHLFDVSPDASRLVYGSPFAGLVVVDTITGEQDPIAPGGPLEIDSVDWNPVDGRIAHEEGSAVFVSKGDAGESGAIVGDAERPARVGDIAWSADGKKLATSTYTDDDMGYMQIWDEAQLRSGEIVNEPAQWFNAGGGGLWWSPDGKSVINGDWDSFTIYSLTSEENQFFAMPDEDHPAALAWSPDGTHIAASDGRDTIWIWDVVSGEIVETLIVPEQFIYAMVWTDHGLIHSGFDNGLFLDGEPVTEPIPSLAVTSFTLMNAGTNADIQTITPAQPQP